VVDVSITHHSPKGNVVKEETVSVSDLVALHHQALSDTGRVVAGITAGQWAEPTPCTDWDVRALLGHVTAGNYWAAELAQGRTISEVGDRLDGDLLGADPLATYTASADAAHAAFSAPGALDRPCAVSYGPVPGSVYVGHRIIDIVLHGWDLATATGQPGRIDDDLAAGCWALLEPQVESFRAAGAFGAAAPHIPADAAPAARLVLATGRRPA
jgi:uncharacterized protein (TIGR03086 family)